MSYCDSMFFLQMIGQACLGFIIGAIVEQFKLFGNDKDWFLTGLVGAFGAVLGTRFLKGTRYHFNNKANWMAACIGSMVIFVFFFIIDNWK